MGKNEKTVKTAEVKKLPANTLHDENGKILKVKKWSKEWMLGVAEGKYEHKTNPGAFDYNIKKDFARFSLETWAKKHEYVVKSVIVRLRERKIMYPALAEMIDKKIAAYEKSAK